jgi:hypothetical protein
MRLDEIIGEAPKLFAGTEWSVTKAEDYPAWIVRARLQFNASHSIDETLMVSTDMPDALIHHVVQGIGMKIENAVDLRSQAARHWRETALRYRDMMSDDPRTWALP